ncbi:MAG: SCO family protein [Pseudomonadota bacterium]
MRRRGVNGGDSRRHGGARTALTASLLTAFASALDAAPAPAGETEGGHALHLQRTAPQVQAPGYGSLHFTPPAPGSYQLPAFGEAGDGGVLLPSGAATTLHALMGDRLVVLSFIYTRCPDPNGCPLATHVLRRLQRRVSEHEALADRVRFLSLSFDPAHDTPQVMGEYQAQVARPRHAGLRDSPGIAAADSPARRPAHSLPLVPWEFLTTSSPQALAPILRAYDQPVVPLRDERGNAIGSFSHILRVYLIDEERHLRNIYSVPFLHPDVLVADLLTLLAQAPKPDR